MTPESGVPPIKTPVEGEVLPSLEKLQERFRPFVATTLQEIYTPEHNALSPEEIEQLANIKPRAVFESPKDLGDPEEINNDVNKADFGTYTLSPETSETEDFSNREVFIPDLSEFHYYQLYTMLRHLYRTYGDEYDFPGVEYYKWLVDNPDKIPEELKTGDFFIFSGSRLRDMDGGWSYFASQWDDTKMTQWYMQHLSAKWGEADKIVLLKKQPK